MFSNLKGNSYEVSFDSRLISLIKVRPFIYDKQNDEYRNNELKEMQWKQIASELNTDVERCKKRWGSLRDRYKRIKKQELLEGNGRHSNRWKYYNVLRFIPYYTDPNSFVEYKNTDDMNEDTMFENEDAGTFSTQPESSRKREHDLSGYFSNFPEEAKRLPDSSSTAPPDATDEFFRYLAKRVKNANLSSIEEMRMEASILNFTVGKLSQLQNEM